MKLALYALTSGAYEQALKIQMHIPEAQIFAKPEISKNKDHAMGKSFSETVNETFSDYDCHLFIMATGIVVRMLAPLLGHKSTDPAVLVGDEKGNYLISLLSGHLGNANTYCMEIAAKVGAEPVITTASDVQGKLAVDTIAMKIGGSLVDFQRAKEMTSRIIENEAIGIVSELPVEFELPFNMEVIEKAEGKSGYIYISNRALDTMREPFAYIRIPRVVLGMGCRRGKAYEDLKGFVEETLEALCIPGNCVKAIGTIDIKGDEVGLLKLADFYDVPLVTWTKEALSEVQHPFEGSDFVLKQIGVKAVSEPAGYLTSRSGKCLKEKIKKDGMTLSVWEDNHESSR